MASEGEGAGVGEGELGFVYETDGEYRGGVVGDVVEDEVDADLG